MNRPCTCLDRDEFGFELLFLPRLRAALDKIGARERVLLLPPDITRLMSKAGELAACEALTLKRNVHGGRPPEEISDGLR